MTHPILEPLVVQLPDKATSRKLIESGGDYDELGYWEKRGYSNTAEPWLNDRYS